MDIHLPLMENNITQDDTQEMIRFLSGMPRLTQGEKVAEFEQAWSRYLGMNYSVFVNSGSSANYITFALLREFTPAGEVILPALTWSSDVVSVLSHGFTPVFADIDLSTLSINPKEVERKTTPRTRAILVTHILGFNGLSRTILNHAEKHGIPVIEDACESYGATFMGKNIGTFGLISNFSFYYAHHLTTIEGGMVCTDNPDIYEAARMYRCHGLAREASTEKLRQKYIKDNPGLSRDFIFVRPGLNFKSTELNAVLGLSQMKRLLENNLKRRENFRLFLDHLDKDRYMTDFNTEGACNYALVLILKHPDTAFRKRLEKALSASRVEFRRGASGGGNQLRQPYLRPYVEKEAWKNYPNVEHVHHFGYYLGNYPALSRNKILKITELLNNLD